MDCRFCGLHDPERFSLRGLGSWSLLAFQRKQDCPTTEYEQKVNDLFLGTSCVLGTSKYALAHERLCGKLFDDIFGPIRPLLELFSHSLRFTARANDLAELREH